MAWTPPIYGTYVMWKARINHQDLEGAHFPFRIVVQRISQHSKWPGHLKPIHQWRSPFLRSLGSETVRVGQQSGANPSGSELELRVCSVVSSFKLPIGFEIHFDNYYPFQWGETHLIILCKSEIWPSGSWFNNISLVGFTSLSRFGLAQGAPKTVFKIEKIPQS